jgi:hypothetical protein
LASPAGSLPLPRWAQEPLSVPYGPGTPAYKLQAETRIRACIRTLPRALQLQALPPCRGGLWHWHVRHDSGPCLAAREGSGAATCHTALNPAFLIGRASVLPCVTWFWTPPPCLGEFQCRHVSHSFGPHLPTQEGSGAATCPTAPDPASLLRKAPVLSCARDPQRVAGLKNKEMFNWPTYAVRLVCFQGATACFRDA